ncbi:MAG: hypothetical protein Q8J99_18110 [Sulfuritalea sp.]|nr:hypothetical protein [Sulfuritalea sp.]
MTNDDNDDDNHDSAGRSRIIQIAVGIAGVFILLLLGVLGIAVSKL